MKVLVRLAQASPGVVAASAPLRTRKADGGSGGGFGSCAELERVARPRELPAVGAVVGGAQTDGLPATAEQPRKGLV